MTAGLVRIKKGGGKDGGMIIAGMRDWIHNRISCLFCPSLNRNANKTARTDSDSVFILFSLLGRSS